ncbi:hypothetical protein H4S04_006335, partial [Coemansia sp. S16]
SLQDQCTRSATWRLLGYLGLIPLMQSWKMREPFWAMHCVDSCAIWVSLMASRPLDTRRLILVPWSKVFCLSTAFSNCRPGKLVPSSLRGSWSARSRTT